MKIEKLKYFIDLYETGSFTQTAKINYISQTSVTQFIYSLEEEFQVKLFNRSTIPITPTEAGKVFYKRAQILYNQYMHSLSIMNNFQMTANTPLKIGFTSRIDLPILMPIVLQFKKLHPEIRISLEKIRIKDTMQCLKSMQCDIVVGLLGENDEFEDGINSLVLYEGQFVAVLSKDDPLAKKKELSAYEAFSHDLCILSPEEIGSNYDIMINGFASGGITPNIVAKCSEINAQLFTIAAEQLLGFVPDNFSLNDFSDYLVKIPLENNPYFFQLHLVYRENDNPSIPYFLDTLPNYSKNK